MKCNLDIDNRKLVEECKAGSKEALNLFYTRFAPRMLSVIHRYVADPQDAEDILHDGFIIAFTRLNSLRDFDHVDYWLATIMKNLSLRFLHNQDVASMLYEIPEVEDTPEFEEIIDFTTLESLIKKLPPGYQKVFRLAVLENKSHKEIAGILGIAPNSSSSQLFHAKLMMRKLITDYRNQTGLLSLLVLIVAGGLLLFQPPQTKVADNILSDNLISTGSNVIKSNEPTDASPLANNPHPENRKRKTENGKQNTENGQPESIPSNFIAKEDNSIPDSETTTTENRQRTTDNGQLTTDNGQRKTEKPHPELPTVASGWSFGAGVNTGIAGFANFNSRSDTDNMANSGDWADPGNNPDEDGQTSSTKSMLPFNATRAQTPSYRNYNNVSHHNYLPISFSLTINKALGSAVSVETGLTYTYLHSTFETTVSKSHAHWHYLGIPLKIKLDMLSEKRFRLYGSVGTQVDFPLYSEANVTTIQGTPDLKAGLFKASTVWSLSASYGAAFKISNKVEIFIEPTLQYHFEHNHLVPNIWTDNPWGFSLPIGFRLNL